MRALSAGVAAVTAAAVLAMSAAAPAAAPPECARTLNGIDLQTATIPQLEAAMAAGRITSVGLVDSYLARIRAYDGQLDSIRQLNTRARDEAAQLDAERAAGHVRGPLEGIPILLKDNYGTNDMPTTAGSIALEGAVPRDDSTVTRKLREAGAVILGKANLSEFAGWVDLNMPPGYSSLGGQVVNANDFDFSPSGSSAGSGVASSMAFSGAAMGTETSGSILSPSDANGIVGVKTTLGLVSRFGILPLAPDFDVPGPMTRSVTDAAVILGAIAGPDPHDSDTTFAASNMPPGGDYTAGLRTDALRGVRLTYSQDDVDALDDQHAELFQAAVSKLESLGATVVPSHTLGNSEDFGLAEIPAIPNEFKASLNQYLADEMPNARVHTLSDIIAYNDQHPDKVKYGQSLLQASDLTPGSRALFGPQATPSRDSAQASIDGALAETGAQAVITPGNAQANIGAAAGYPTVMVPLGYTNGGKDPFGLGFMGQTFTEPKLLGYAYAWEQASRARVPPTDINPKLSPAACQAAGSAPSHGSPVVPAPRRLPALRVRVRRRGHLLRVSIAGALGSRVQVRARRGKRLVAHRGARTHGGRARLRIRLGRRVHGLVRLAVLDPGPPARTTSAHARLR